MNAWAIVPEVQVKPMATVCSTSRVDRGYLLFIIHGSQHIDYANSGTAGRLYREVMASNDVGHGFELDNDLALSPQTVPLNFESADSELLSNRAGGRPGIGKTRDKKAG